jgi:hypothetical protein
VQPAAIGLRARTGSAVVVALVGDPAAPTVVVRRSFRLVTDNVPPQPYHVASELHDRADEIIGRTLEVAEQLARRELDAVTDELREGGFDVRSAGIVLGSGFVPTRRQALSQHAAMHAAEGELYREVVSRVCEEIGWKVVGCPERDVASRAASVLRVADLTSRLVEIGRAMGSPWRKEHKLATAVAWLALAGTA